MKLKSMNVLFILLAILLAGFMSGCVENKTTENMDVSLSNWMGHMGPDYLFEGNVYPVKLAFDGEYLVEDSKVSLLILNTNNPINATVSMELLVNNEKIKPEHTETSEMVRGINILSFENNSGFNTYIWKDGNVVFRLESADKRTLDRIFDIHKILFVDDPQIYLERVQLSVGSFDVPCFQLFGNYKIENGEASYDINVFQETPHAKKVYEDRNALVNRMYAFKLRLNQNELEEVRKECLDGASCLPEAIWDQTDDTLVYTTYDGMTHGLLLRNNLLLEFQFTGMSEEEINNVLSNY